MKTPCRTFEARITDVYFTDYGDVATISNTCATSVKKLCVEFQGTNNNNVEPKELKNGISNYCKYSSIPSC